MSFDNGIIANLHNDLMMDCEVDKDLSKKIGHIRMQYSDFDDGYCAKQHSGKDISE